METRNTHCSKAAAAGRRARKEGEEDGDKLEKILSSPHLAPPNHEQGSPHTMSLFPYYCQQFPAFTGLIFVLGALAKYPCRLQGLADRRRHGRRREKRRVRKEKTTGERPREGETSAVPQSLTHSRPKTKTNPPKYPPRGVSSIIPAPKGILRHTDPPPRVYYTWPGLSHWFRGGGGEARGGERPASTRSE